MEDTGRIKDNDDYGGEFTNCQLSIVEIWV